MTAGWPPSDGEQVDEATLARAEEALRQSEARLRVLIESTTQTVWETDGRGIVVADSPSWRAYTGQSVDEWLSEGWLSTVHPDDRPHAEWQWRQAIEAGRSVNAEFRLQSPMGGWQWTNLRAGPLRDRSGTIVKWVGMNLDITARKGAEAALREAEARQSFLLELSDQMSTLNEPREILELAGRRLAQSLGMPAPQPAAPAASSQKQAWLASLLSTAHPARRWTEGEKWLQREVAERTWAAVERARGEDALRRSEQRLKRALSIETVGVLFFKLDGRILDANTTFERMSGYDRDELRRDVLWQALTPPEFADVAARCIENLAQSGQTPAYEKQLLRKDGSRWWGLFAPTRIGGSGHDSECVEFILDISEHKRVQQQREDLLAAITAAHADAERANKAKDEFLATLSHELRTPLAAILLWAAALRSGAAPPQDRERAIEAIVASAQSQSRLIEDLLDLSRLTSGNFLFAPASTEIEGVGHAAADVVRPMAQAKGIALEVTIPDGIGTAVLDAARFKQVLWNLLSNATKFTPAGGRIVLRLRRREEWLEAEVSDTGVGIAPEFMPHVFERFRQADMGETRQHAGLGIGLALSRQLVELQGGTIEAYSEGLGHGTLFRVCLPWIDGESSAAGAEDAFVRRRAPRPSLEGVTVLLVEDDASTRDAMKQTLAHAGASVVPVASGDEALSVLERVGGALASTPAPNVIVCDLGLPGMSGHELLERLVRRSRALGQRPLPACAVSAHARDVDRQRAMAAGFDLYLAKPIEPDRLIEAVEDLRDVAAAPLSVEA
jgi:PAS domain S-box-containing protein